MNRRQLIKAGFLAALGMALAPVVKLFSHRPLTITVIDKSSWYPENYGTFDIVAVCHPIPRDKEGNACWISGKPVHSPD